MDSPSDIISIRAELAERGVTLRTDGTRLLFGPKANVPPDLLTRMRQYKSALIAALPAACEEACPVPGSPAANVSPGAQPETAATALPPLVLDLETFFDARFSLKRLTIPEYTHDERFAVHGLAVRHPDGHSEFRRDVATVLQELKISYGSNFEQATIVGHNLAFDLYVLSERYGVRPANVFDTLLAAYHLHGRRGKAQAGIDASLRALATRYGLSPKGDLGFMAGVRDPSPEQWAELSEYAVNDVQITYELAVRMLPRVTRSAVELPVMAHTLRLFLAGRIRIDTAALADLQGDITKALESKLHDAGATSEQVSRDTQFRKLLEQRLARTQRPMPTKPGKKGPIPATARNDKAMHALVNDHDPAVAALAKARIEKKGADQKLSRLAKLEKIAAATGGCLPVSLVYCGAHTGRFAGGGGFNIQNLGREGLGKRIRELLVPEPGHVFVIGDFAQIEARVLAWLAGQQQQLDAFRQEGRDLYSEFISAALGWQVRKPDDADPPELKADLNAKRQVGKQAVLGLGFGLGIPRFIEMLRSDVRAAALFEHGPLTDETCGKIVTSYRKQYPEIPTFWRSLEMHTRWTAGGMTGSTHGLRLEPADGETLLWLPSGRALRYPGLRIGSTPGVRRNMHAAAGRAFQPKPTLEYGDGIRLYGGLLTENAVQAVARDLLVDAILKLEQLGLPVVFHVHDEVVVTVPEDQKDRAVQTVKQELSRVPEWAKGLPVACEVKASRKYGK